MADVFEAALVARGVLRLFAIKGLHFRQIGNGRALRKRIIFGRD
jgi:hypothetical protein